MINEKLSIEEVKQKFFNSKEYEQVDQKYNFSNQKEPLVPKGFFDDYPRFFLTSKTVFLMITHIQIISMVDSRQL